MIGAVVLAAGRSLRFGEQKLLVPVCGKPLLRWTVERVVSSGVDRTLVVVGPDAEAHRGALARLDVDIVVNAAPELGLGGSLRTGVSALPAGTSAAVIALADQPAIPDDVIPRLIARFREGGAPIVMPSYNGDRGHPVLFAASMFPELAAIDGDRGARDLLAARLEKVALVPVDAAVPSDVDTLADVPRVEAEISRRSSRTA